MSALLSCMQIPTLLIPSIASSSSSSITTREKKHHQCIHIPTHSLKHQLHSQSPTPRVIKCFSNRQSQSTEQEFEFEFERLFSNLNQATLTRESGNYFFFNSIFFFFLVSYSFICWIDALMFFTGSLSSAIFLVAGTTVRYLFWKFILFRVCLVLWYCVL